MVPGAAGEPLGCPWADLGGILGSLGVLGSFLGFLGESLGVSGASLRGPLGSWGYLGSLGDHWEGLGGAACVFELSWQLLESIKKHSFSFYSQHSERPERTLEVSEGSLAGPWEARRPLGSPGVAGGLPFFLSFVQWRLFMFTGALSDALGSPGDFKHP